MKREIKKWHKLPKSAITNDKESYFGMPNKNNSRQYIHLVYETRKIKYIITNENPNYKIERICIRKQERE